MADYTLSAAGRTMVMIATYNERAVFERIIEKIWEAADVDILIIDDSSPDGTGDIADAIASKDARMSVVHRPSKAGVATAHVLAFRHAIERGYARVVEMDADFSHPPEVLPSLIDATTVTDVSLGSRCVPGARIVGRSRWRNVVTSVGGWYARAVLRIPVRDCTGGYRCSRVSALRMIDFDRLQSRGYGFQLELNYAWARAGISTREIPITFVDRTEGTSKMSMGILLESLVMVLRLRLGRVPIALIPAEPSSVHSARI